MNICSVKGCQRNVIAKGYCTLHYQRIKNHGDDNYTDPRCHGKTNTLEYNSWRGMRNRCYQLSGKEFSSYGGRGIKVCARWLKSFQYFLDDMGERPTPKHQIDRIDNNGDYDPSNCRWVTCAENQKNKSNNKLNWIKVREIRAKYLIENNYKKLGREYNVASNTIKAVVLNRIWK